MMRVGIDVRELAGHPTGVGRYLRELLVRWHADPTCHGADLHLFSPEPVPLPGWPQGDLDGATLTWHHVPGGTGTWWQQHHLAAAALRARLDVFFAPAYTAPLRLEAPSVVAMHDVSFAAHPEWFAWRHGLRLRRVAAWSAARAHTVLTLTHAAAADITTYLRVPPDRVRVIPLAVDYHDAAPPPATPPPPRPVVLFVGSVFERRHLPLLMEGVALARGRVPDLRLEVIGENRTHPRQDLSDLARRLGLADAVGLRAYVSDAELHAAYGTAGVFAFLSEYEGFGLTPLEAMRHGLPTVVLDTPVAREVYGAGARYVPQGDAGAVANALVTLLRDADARAAQCAAGAATVAQYRWADTARQTWEILSAAAGRRRA